MDIRGNNRLFFIADDVTKKPHERGLTSVARNDVLRMKAAPLFFTRVFTIFLVYSTN